jgi:hypothetical protein
MGFGRLVMVSQMQIGRIFENLSSQNVPELRAVFSVEASFLCHRFDFAILAQEVVVNCLLVLSFFIDEPDAIQPIPPAVVAYPKPSADVFPPRFRW